MIVNYDNKFLGDILIEEGFISKIGHNLPENRVKLIDAEGRYIFPGFIDVHTHPGLPEDLSFYKKSNDFFTETNAAVKGGTTTIFDFAQQDKGERLIDALEKRKHRYVNSACCKVSFHVAITDVKNDIGSQLEEIKGAGINSVKIYTTYDMKLRNEDILRVMKECARLKMTVLVHCEEDSIISFCSGSYDFESTRPVEAEEIMISTIIGFAKVTSCTTYICHVSSLNGYRLIKSAKEEGAPIYMETCPQYLLLNSLKYREDIRERTKYILSPPLREEKHRLQLVNACMDGTVDVISSDHCAFLYKEHKEKYYDDIKKVAKGIPGIQLRGVLAYSLLVEEQGMPVEEFVRLISYKPSKIFSLGDRGYIEEGREADLVIWDRSKYKISISKLSEGTDYTPYENLEVIGSPWATFTSFDKGQIKKDITSGQY